MAEPRTILITCAAQNAALASARSLHRAGWHVTLVDSDQDAKAFRSKACDQKFVVADSPGEHPEGYAQAILDYLAAHPHQVLLPVTDAAIFALLPRREELERLTTVVWASTDSLIAAADKEATMRRARDLGIPVPLTAYLGVGDPIPPALRFPVVIKPRRSLVFGHKYAVTYANNETELLDVLAHLPAGARPALVQERIVGPGQGYFGVWRHGEPVVEFAHQRVRETPPSGGVSTLREAIALPDDLRDFSRRLLGQWRWHGPVMVEYKRGVDGVPYLMEVNGRLWGSLQLAVDAGIDVPLASVLVAIGEPVPPMTVRTGIRTRWELGDLDATLTRFLKKEKELDLPPNAISRGRWLTDFVLDFFRPRVKNEVWRWDDIGPFLAEARRWSGKWRVLAGLPQRRRGLPTVLHAHSTFSHDGEMSIAELAAFLRQQRVRVCCLSEHARDLNAAAVDRMTTECERVSGEGFVMVPGLEFEPAPDCHILGLGVNKYLTETDPAALVKAIREAGGIAVLAHPTPGWLRANPVLARSFDAIEVWNTARDGTFFPASVVLKEWREVIGPAAVPRAIHGVDLHRIDNLKRVRLFVQTLRPEWPAVRRALLDGAYSFGHAPVRVGPAGLGGVRRTIVRFGRGMIHLLRPLRRAARSWLRAPCWEYLGCECTDCPARTMPDGGDVCWRVVGTFGGCDHRARHPAHDCAECDFYRQRTGQRPKRLRVMHLIETGNPGGAERMMLSLIKGLGTERHANHVVLLKPGWLEKKTREQGSVVSIVPLGRRFNWRFVLALCRLVRRRHIDVLHSHEFAMNVYSSVVGLLTRRATVATVHGNLSYLQARFRRRQAYRLIARLAGPMVVVSEEMKGQVATRFGISPRYLRVIPNGVEIPTRMPDATEIATQRELLDLPRDAFLLAVIGSLYPVKGQMTLVEAMPALVAEFPQVHLAIVGRGDMRAPLEQRVAALGLASHVTFTGFVDNIRDQLPIFDLIVVPSRYEGLSLLVLEAMAVARPVIATQVGGNPEAIIDGESGLLVPPDNAPALVEACRRVIKDPAFAARLGQAALQRVRDNFTLEHMVAAYEDLYRRQLGRRGR